MTTGNDLSNEARRLNHVNSTGVLPNRDAGVPIRQSQQSNAVRQFILFHQRHRFLTSATLLSALLHLLVLGCLGLMIFKAPSLVENLLNTILERDSMGIDEGQLSFELPSTGAEFSDSEERTDSAALPEAPQQFSILPQQLNSVDVKLPFESTATTSANGGSSTTPGEMVGQLISGRTSSRSRQKLVEKHGGSRESEAAVKAGLTWLLNHQLPNGSWSFEHTKHSQCRGSCSQDGRMTHCTNGATGMALLCFLGAGHTHQTGEYQRAVLGGIEFLLKSSKTSRSGRDFRGHVISNEGMYVQGICAIAFSECAAMTRDPRIRKAAEGALLFIVKSQNEADGGWRYHPGDPGDTSVSGWQIMALKSGNNARIELPPKSFRLANHFLNLVQSHRGSQYGYRPLRQGPPSGEVPSTPSMTAVGLLCRMYLGWDRDDARLEAGVKYLTMVKPLENDMYFNFYATQVLHHWGGEEWNTWNVRMRDMLIQTQKLPAAGHMAGSWDLADPHATQGGRLYMTCLSVMTLEIYYRFLPLFDEEGLKIDL